MTRLKLTDRLRKAQDATVDSPFFQLVSGLPVPEVDHSRIDAIRDHRDPDEALRVRLDTAVSLGSEAVRSVEEGLGPSIELSAMTVLSLIGAYRSLEAWPDMVRVVRSSSRALWRLEIVRQQYGWALNRAGEDREAERVLTQLLHERPSSETSGLLGRVHKDRWKRASSAVQARGQLHKAIDVYVRGYETDLRDPYPGVNAVMLMSVADPPDLRLPRLLPVVRYT